MRCVTIDAMEWKTIRVPEQVYEDAKERKEQHGVTWGQYLNPHAWKTVFDAPTDAPDGNAIAKDEVVADKLEELLEANISDTKDNSPVELEASEYSKIAREVVEALR